MPASAAIPGRSPRGAPELARQLQSVLPRRLAGANLAGGVLVFAIGLTLSPVRTSGTTSGIVVYLVALAVYVPVAMTCAWQLGRRLTRSVSDWLAFGGDRAPEVKSAALALPYRLAAVWVGCWAVGGVLFGTLVRFGPDVAASRSVAAVKVGFGTLLGGLATGALGFLLVEREMRPVFARAFADAALPGGRLLGVRPRLVVAWLLGSGIPLLAVAMTYIGTSRAQRASVTTGGILLLVGTALLSGWLVLAAVASSVADPIELVAAAMSRVEAGDRDLTVRVDDGGEIGVLQRGFNQMVVGLRERDTLNDLFGRHVGDEVARRALSEGADREGELREVSVLFVDLVGSTRLAETQPAPEVVAVLNELFTTVVDAVRAEAGWVDKFVGDGALCVFGAPAALGDHAARALRTARRLQTDVHDVDVGIGVASGTVVAGNVGAADRYAYTVIGDAVNVAARLSDIAKVSSSNVLADEVTVAQAGDEASQWNSAGTHALRGRERPCDTYRPVAAHYD